MNSRADVRSRRSRAFTLIEMMIVIALGAILMTLSMTSLGGLRGGPKFTTSIASLSGFLEGGRQKAIGGNTYVWILFAPPTETGKATSKGDELAVAIYERQDGSGTPLMTGNVIGTEGEAWALSSRSLSIPQVILKDKGEVSFASLPAEDSLAGLAPVAVTVVHAGRSTSYTRGVLFAPNGIARVGAGLSRYVEFGLALQGQPANSAVIRINSLTGKPWVYRP